MSNVLTNLGKQWLYGLLAMAYLSACGGNGSPQFHANVTPNWNLAPTSREAVSASGVITAVTAGGADVNGVHYRMDPAVVTVNGQSAGMTDLKVGQYVSLEGSIETDGRTGSADRLTYEATVIGPLESMDPTIGRMIVMGQTVLIDEDTVFDGGIDPDTYAGLDVGSHVEISGLVKAGGDVVSTRIERHGNSAAFRVSGAVSGLDSAAGFFAIGRLSIDYRNADIDLRGGVLAAGMFVRVKGSLANGILAAEVVEDLYGIQLFSLGERTRIEGLVTHVVSSSEFTIPGMLIRASSDTDFVNGMRRDLLVGARVTVDGDVSAAGDSITATEIAFRALPGPTTTVTYGIDSFTAIEIRSVFNVSVRQGPAFSVEVTVDSDVLDKLNVARTGSTLVFDLGFGDNNVNVLDAVVYLPVLDRIIVGGVSRATLHGFDQMQMSIDVNGVSQLRGDKLRIGDLDARVSGVSLLELGDIRPMGAANVRVSGVSRAFLNMDVRSTLTGSVTTGQGTGSSSLLFYGTDVDVNVTTDAMSSVTRLGDTRP